MLTPSRAAQVRRLPRRNVRSAHVSLSHGQDSAPNRDSPACPSSLCPAAEAATARRALFTPLRATATTAELASCNQVRSVASESCKQHNALQRGRVLDWYAADFQEELSGMDGADRQKKVGRLGQFFPNNRRLTAGSLLARQTAFVVHAMKQLERMYGAASNSAPVILLGHSMGGLVARAAVVHPECPPGKPLRIRHIHL
jgi:hypothetical protein